MNALILAVGLLSGGQVSTSAAVAAPSTAEVIRSSQVGQRRYDNWLSGRSRGYYSARRVGPLRRLLFGRLN